MRASWLLAAILVPLSAGPAAADFNRCVAGLKSSVVAAGVSPTLAAQALDGAQPKERVVRASKNQPEFKTPIWDYMAFLVDEARVTDGQAMLRQHDALLRRIEAQYGVDRHVVTAVWGVETDYGREMGTNFIPHALTTLICETSRRRDFWRGELVAALKLVQRGDLPLDDLRGSWAGAFGQTQFIPSTYQRLAVDFDGDGRRDLVRSVPDALASTANYLKRGGWRTGESWLIEARVPRGYRGASGRTNKTSLDSWSRRGITRADGAGVGGGAQAGLLLPAGANGPAFFVFRNFDAIYSYNQAESYALAISHLADRIAGYPPLRTPWPTDDPGLSRAERLELQHRLIAKGYDIGEADGKIGPITRGAIAEAEKALGLPVTGRAGRRIYNALGG